MSFFSTKFKLNNFCCPVIITTHLLSSIILKVGHETLMHPWETLLADVRYDVMQMQCPINAAQSDLVYEVVMSHWCLH
jgi:hypothetical protein